MVRSGLLAVVVLALVSSGCAAGDQAGRRQTVDPHTLIDVRGTIGGISAGETRARAGGLRVASTLAQARRTPGIRCYRQVGYIACQGGLGYEKPVTSFTVRNGKVVGVSMAAAAD